MSVTLCVKQDGVEVELNVKTTPLFFNGETVLMFGEHEIPLEDFLEIAMYVLTNTDLDSKNDPRLQFVRSMKSVVQTEGYNKGKKRLVERIPLYPVHTPAGKKRTHQGTNGEGKCVPGSEYCAECGIAGGC